MDVRKGETFVHDRLLDTDWKPGPGEKYADAPKALMVITRTTSDQVWYGYFPAHPRSTPRYVMARPEFTARFGDQA